MGPNTDASQMNLPYSLIHTVFVGCSPMPEIQVCLLYLGLIFGNEITYIYLAPYSIHSASMPSLILIATL